MIDARRGKRLNVVGALLSSGGLFAAKLWETMTSMLFVGFLGLLLEHVGKPLTVILDNASGPHGPRTAALSPAATNERLDVVLSATVQPGAQSHRKALAQDEIRVAGLQGPRHPNP